MEAQTYPFWSPAELRALAEQVIAGFSEHSDEVERDYEKSAALHDELMAALRALAAVAAETRDVSLVPDLVRWLDEAESWKDREHTLADQLGMALERCARPALAPDKRARWLAANAPAPVRAAMARTLDPADEAAQALLESLIEDGDARVHQVARKRLAAARDLNWWRGRFPSDPYAGIDDDERARRRPHVEAIVTWFELKPWQQHAGLSDLLAALAALPDDLAVPVLARLYASTPRYGILQDRDIGLALLGRPGGPEIYGELLVRPEERNDLRMLEDWIDGVPGPARQAAALAAVAAVRKQADPDESTLMQVSRMVAELWPKGLDPAPLAPWYLELTGVSDHRSYAGWLEGLFSAAGVPLPTAEGWGEEEV